MMKGGIMSVVAIFVVFIAVSHAGTTENPFSDIFEDVSSCKHSCELTYSLHTYPEAGDLKACNRGCRLFSMLDFMDSPFSTDFNTTKQECNLACSEAYPEKASALYACHLGCTNQLPFAIKAHQQWKEESHVHFLMPMFNIHNIWQQLLDTANGMTFSYWSVYMQDESGQVYVFDSEPKIDIFTLYPEGSNKLQAKTFSKPETNLQAFQPQTATDCNENALEGSSSWLDCVSRKSGLPRWLLSVTLFLSVLALIWLCCVTLVTAPDQRISSPKLSIYGDLAYLKKGGTIKPMPILIQNMPVKKSASQFTDDDDDVEPLPLKVDITVQKSVI